MVFVLGSDFEVAACFKLELDSLFDSIFLLLTADAAEAFGLAAGFETFGVTVAEAFGPLDVERRRLDRSSSDSEE